ncbi:MAG: hypothetical protein DRH26_00100 [Deltaproteobacteria bacterium]|nr:MAG: hypothetical protein DRH26_00100 [Deltaproteobacteria bacterium]
MADPVIPNVPTSLSPSEIAFFTALKSGIEYLFGQGRFKEDDRAVKVSELDALRAQLGQNIDSVALGGMGDTDLGDAPDPPTNLIVTKIPFVHILTWDNPTDITAWYIEVWAAEGSQSRDDARLEGIYTITEDVRGEEGTFKHSGFTPTEDMTYWIRSVSYSGLYSQWCPPDDQGGYVVPGDETLQDFIDGILDILHGNITENELYQDLNSRIDLIDADDFGLWDKVEELRLTALTFTDYENKTYAIGDIVEYNNKLYICIQTISSLPAPIPTNTSYWEKIGITASLTTSVTANSSAIGLVTSTVNDTEDGVLANASKIDDLAGDITDPLTGLGASANAIDALEVTVNHSITGVLANASNITDLTSAIEDPTTGLDASAGAIDILQAAVSHDVIGLVASSNRITALAVTVGNIDTEGISVNADAIDSLEVTVNHSVTGVSASALKITNLTATIEDPVTGLSVTAGAVSSLQTDVSDIEGDITAISSAVTGVTTTVGENTTAVEVVAESVDGLEGKYTVKVDNNGYVSGFGLASTNNNSTPTSEFIVLVDEFKIVTPGKSPCVPFAVGTVSGVSTVGIDGNMVVDGTITALKIDADAITANHIDANVINSTHIAADAIQAEHIDTSEIYVGMLLQSTSYSSRVSGWKIDNNGIEVNSSGGLTLNQNSDIYFADSSGNQESRIDNVPGYSGPMGDSSIIWYSDYSVCIPNLRTEKLYIDESSSNNDIGEDLRPFNDIYTERINFRRTYDYIQAEYSDEMWWMYFYVGNAYRMTLASNGKLWISGECSANSFVDRSHIYTGDNAIDLLKAIQPESQDNSPGSWKKVDHDTLPDTVKVTSKRTEIREKVSGKLVQKKDLPKDHNPEDYDEIEIEVPGRDIGRQLQIATQAILLLTARVEKLESQLEKQESKKAQ